MSGCDFDGIKVFLCQLVCLLIDDLLCFNDSICDLIYNSIISCTWFKCTMDINVKYHCYLILTYIMLSDNPPKREKLNQSKLIWLSLNVHNLNTMFFILSINYD